MRVLLTGAAGFVGRNLLARRGRDHDWVAVYRSGDDFPAWCADVGAAAPRRCDLSDPDSVAAAFAPDESFDAVVHLAANGDPAASLPRPAMDLRCGPLALVTLFERVRAARLIYFSSGAVYDGCRGVVHPDTPVRPTLPYAIGKLAAEHYVRALRERHGRIAEYVIVRFFGAYGPYEPPRKIFTKLVRTFAIERASRFTVRGDGRNLIDAMFVGDAVDALARMLDAPAFLNQTLDLACGRPMSLDELVLRAAACFGVAQPIVEHQGVVPEYNLFRADETRAAALLGFRAATPLERGLHELHGHLTDHKESPSP